MPLKSRIKSEDLESGLSYNIETFCRVFVIHTCLRGKYVYLFYNFDRKRRKTFTIKFIPVISRKILKGKVLDISLDISRIKQKSLTK